MDLSQWKTDALLSSTFRDEYTLDRAKLESLYSKAKRHQWNAELDVDWDRFEPDVDVLDRKADLLSRLTCVQELGEDERTRLFKAANLFLISQVLHGEQAALMTCGQLVNAVPEMDGKFAAASQVIDEARHVEVFARYLHCHGTRFPIDPDLQRIVSELLSESDWEAKCVGMQVILESIALSFFRLGEEMAVEPVFAQFIGRVHEDEARHVAYGVLTMEDRIPELSDETRERLENWAYDAIARIGGRAGKPAFSSQFQALATAGIDLGQFVPKLMGELANPTEIDWTGLREPMAQTVLPNLLRIGLVPERLVPGYLAQGWVVDRDAHSVKNIHTFADDAQAVRALYREQGLDFAIPTDAAKLSL